MGAEASNRHTVRGRGLPRPDLRQLRRLGRAVLLGPSSRVGRVPDAIEHLAKAHRLHHPGADLTTLRRAYLLAESSHRGQTRKSGEPYITHPLAVTLILAELGAETTTLTASLLHDTVEDTELTLETVGDQFGAEVRFLVDGVTKLEKVDYGAAAEPETFRKMLVATGNDVRVMSIKLADRLHNMRTIGVMRPEKQVRIARVTQEVLIPLAERLGVQALKSELEDLVFQVLHPPEYERTRQLVLAHGRRPCPLREVASDLQAALRAADIDARVLVRERHLVSVHRVLRSRGAVGGADLARLLVLVGEDADCYAVLGELHSCFTPVVSEFRDFIAVPKFNLYQSLHTAVATAGGEVAEVLIRTHRMHRVAQAGVIALGNPYSTGAPGVGGASDGVREDGERADPTRPGWLSRLLEWQRAAPDPDTFWTSLRDDLAKDLEITVFSADGRAIGLPEGASCVDAAYSLHGEGAHAAIGARVNGRLTALGTVLRDGDRLHLLMARDGGSGPSPDWLRQAVTPGARIAITRWLAVNAGHGPGATAAARPAYASTPAADAQAAVTDLPGVSVRLAGCRAPVPPEAVTGFAVRGGAVAVHQERCPTVSRMTGTGRTPLGAHWHEEPAEDDSADFRVTLGAEAFSRPRLLADLTEAIAAHGAAVVSAAVEPPRQQRVRHTYTLRLADSGELPPLIRAIRLVPGVYDVWRAGARPAPRR